MDATEPNLGPIGTNDDVKRAAPDIIALFNDDPDRLLAAAANPILALRDAGLDLDPATERWIANRCRFDEDQADKLESLFGQIEKHLGPIDPEDDQALLRRFAELGIDVGEVDDACRAAEAAPAEVSSPPPISVAKSKAKGKGKGPSEPKKPGKRRPPLHPGRRSAITAGLANRSTAKWRELRRSGPDPFELLRDAHEVVEPLLSYRTATRGRSRFAPEEQYLAFKKRQGGQLSTGINISLRVSPSGGS